MSSNLMYPRVFCDEETEKFNSFRADLQSFENS